MNKTSLELRIDREEGLALLALLHYINNGKSTTTIDLKGIGEVIEKHFNIQQDELDEEYDKITFGYDFDSSEIIIYDSVEEVKRLQSTYTRGEIRIPYKDIQSLGVLIFE